MKKPSAFKNIVRGILGKDEKRSRLEKEIVKLAQRKGGQLSILEIVAETSLSTKEADEIMEEMTVKGYVTMDVTESGGIVYTFPGMAEKARQEKQEWFKREVSRETSPSPPPKPEPRPTPESPRRSASSPPFPPPEQKTRRPAPSPPPRPKVIATIEVQGFNFELQECRRSGNNVVCSFQVKSNKQNKKLALRPAVKILDSSGKEYSARIQIISGDVEDAIEYLWISLRAWIPLKLTVTINMGSWQATWQTKSLALLELSCKNDILGPEFTAPFREIPIS